MKANSKPVAKKPADTKNTATKTAAKPSAKQPIAKPNVAKPVVQVEQVVKQPEEEKKEVISQPPIPPVIVEPVIGSVVVKYNHYKEQFQIVDGVLKEDDILEQYCLSYAFSGDFQINLRVEKDKERTYLPKLGKVWHEIEDGVIYIIDIEEDAVEEAEKRKNAKPI